MLAVLEVLETKPSRDVTLNLLKIVNMVREGQSLANRLLLIVASAGCDG